MSNSVLIVDDDAVICSAIKEYLERAGYHTAVAHSAEEADQILKTQHFAVVITDIILPGMDGLALTALIKSEYDSEVIVITGYSSDYSYEMAIQNGANDLIFKPMRLEELLLRLKRVLKERQLTRERLEMMEKLQKIAITDSLTKLFNSRHFFKQLALEIDRSDRYQHPLSLLLLDIDHFKRFNDTYGHLEGDRVLRRLGEIITSCLRIHDTAYRYGGEEFTIILPVTSGEEANTVAHRIRAAVEVERFQPVPGSLISVTVSIGVTEYQPGEDLAIFLKRSDEAMYVSKRQGRNRVSLLSAPGLKAIPIPGHRAD